MTDWQEYRFHQWLRRLDQAARYAGRHQEQDRAGHVAFGRRVEALAADILRGRGRVVSSTGHQAHHDLWADGARVEVKAATWDGRRWQFNLRRSSADVYVLACVRGHRVIAWFVVPGGAVGERRHLAVWNADPGAYAGWLSEYRGAWGFVDQAAAGTSSPGQLTLWS